MFTGIVEGVGVVRTAEQRGDVLVARVDVGGLFEGLPLGGSVAVNGCCLTAVESDAEGVTVELTGETLKRTRFDERLQPGARINLERPMKAVPSAPGPGDSAVSSTRSKNILGWMPIESPCSGIRGWERPHCGPERPTNGFGW